MTMILPIQVRTDIDANWNLGNPILKKGEVGYSSDGNSYKIGDGITDWGTLQNAFEGPGFKYSWNDAADKTAQTGMKVGDKGYQLDTSTIYEYDGTTWNAFAVLSGAFKGIYATVALRDADVANLNTGDLVLTDGIIQKYNGTGFESKTSNILPIRETFATAPDGVIVLFSTTGLAQGDIVDVYMNGVLQEEGFDYTKVINGTVYDITFTTAPLTGARLRASYLEK